MRVCYRTKHCYPQKRRLLCLAPGIILAVVGMCIFAFAETESNYPYTHSAWHLCMSISIVFLLPDKRQQLRGTTVFKRLTLR